MKKDITVIREAIKKVVNLLTNRSIKVTQRGSKAYVQYHAKTGAIQLVNLPYMPDDASDEFVAAVQGFLDHEVGHVLYTDPKIMPALSKESAKVKNLANAIEDVYIERRMSEAFSGSVGNLNAVRRFHIDRIAKPKIDEALAAGNIAAATGYAGLVQFRAWGGQQIAADFLRDNPKYAALVKPLEEKLGADLIAKIKKANSSKDCLALAKQMSAKMSEPEEKAPPSEGEGAKGDSKSGKGEKSDKGDSTADHADKSTKEDHDEKKPEPEDKGTTKTETDDSDKEREESSKTEEDATPDAGDSEGTEEGEREEGEEGEGKDGSKDVDEDAADGEEGESAPPDADMTEDDSADADDEAEEGGDGELTDGEAEEHAGMDGAPERSETDVEADDTEDEASPLSDAFEETRDFDEEISKVLSEAAKEEIGDAAYQIFSTDWDEIGIPAPKCVKDESIEKMVEDTQHMVASIQKGLERALAAKARKTWNPGQRRGRIAPGALFKTAVGDDRVFRQRYETQAKNTAVSLLVDCSGSMSCGGKIETAGRAAFALSSTLERLKITHEVIGFTTKRIASMTSAMSAEGMGIKYARSQALYMPLFKGFNERLTVDAKSRMAHLTEYHSHDWLKENVDGECLQIAAQRLKQQRAERHLLIVLSDGSPACPGNWVQLRDHLRDVAKKLDKDGGVEVVGIGILDRSVENFYEKHVVLNGLNELPTTVVGELAKVLLAP